MADLIYITEDDESIRELVKITLISFSYEVCAFENAEDTLLACSQKIPSLFIFDIMLPGIDGISAVRKLRGDSKMRDIPIIMLTAKDAEFDKITGLDAGADDYITKPFGVMELAARVRALLRRNRQTEMTGEIIKHKDIHINPKTRECFKNDRSVELTFKEFELLYLLMSHVERVIPREELINTIWGYDFVGETRTLDVHIKTLRRKINDDPENAQYIKTVRGVGYRFCE